MSCAGVSSSMYLSGRHRIGAEFARELDEALSFFEHPSWIGKPLAKLKLGD